MLARGLRTAVCGGGENIYQIFLSDDDFFLKTDRWNLSPNNTHQRRSSMNTETNVNQQPVQQSNLQQLNQEHERGVAQDPVLPMLLPACVDQVHVLMLPVSVLQSDANQPRKHFDEAEIDSLAASIRAHGLINPITVRRVENNVFYVVAGDPSPSSEDIAITRRLKEVGDLLGIKVMDHVIVGTDGMVSLLERGVM